MGNRIVRVIAVTLGLLLIAIGHDFLFSGPVQAASYGPCTKGSTNNAINCYGDKVTQPTGEFYDPNVLWVEDWDHPDWYGNPTGSQAWWRDGGVSGARGFGNKWTANFGSVTGAAAWTLGQPGGTPYFGPNCTAGSTCYAREYCSAAQGTSFGSVVDCWGPGTNAGTGIDIQGPTDANAEISGLTLTGGNNGHVFSGNAYMAYRIPTGSPMGILGRRSWADSREIGITMALAYSSNVVASGILNSPWKHDEWGEADQHWNLGLTGTGPTSVRPYKPFFWMTGGAGPCNTALSNATLFRGSTPVCNGAGLIYGADPAYYNQSTNFPYGTWGCHQAHITGIGTTNVTLKLWHNSVLIFHLTNFDGTLMTDATNGWGSVDLNAYANANQGTGETPTTQTAYRYQDNIHIRRGAPVSCQQIGFAPVNPPSAPTGLQVK